MSADLFETRSLLVATEVQRLLESDDANPDVGMGLTAHSARMQALDKFDLQESDLKPHSKPHLGKIQEWMKVHIPNKNGHELGLGVVDANVLYEKRREVGHRFISNDLRDCLTLAKSMIGANRTDDNRSSRM